MNKKTLVFGASLKPYRYSHLALSRLVENGIETVAFGKKEGEVAGVRIQTKLGGFKDLHTITLYMNPVKQRPFYDELVRLAPRRVIFNPGTENPELEALLHDRGIETERACTLVLLATGMF